jgi:hypothetical protein
LSWQGWLQLLAIVAVVAVTTRLLGAYLARVFGDGPAPGRCPARKRLSCTHTDDFDVDLAAKRVTISNGEIRLTPTEWAIVEILVRNPGKLVTQRQLLQEVWRRNTRRRRTTYASISPRSARSSSPIRRSRATSSRKPGWATGSSRHDRRADV